ncbi:MAG: YdcF family protein [Clostridia bacterium]|nr:YdcF family protein [Clostridia bacterium]
MLFIVFCACLSIGVIIGIYAVCVNAHVINSTDDYILSVDDASALEDVDCILVLGAGVDGDTLSHMLEDRVKTGITLYENGAAPKILMSGDHGREEYDEVNAMKSYATDYGVPSEDIFMDHAGFSTYESMYRARDIFCAEKIIIISQEYHLYRAIYIARYLGLDAYGVDSQLRPYAADTNIYNTIREFLARNKDFLYVRFNPEPTYLGETVPISGNGNVTNDKVDENIYA